MLARSAVLLMIPIKYSRLNRFLPRGPIVSESLQIPFFVSNRLRTLSFSVSCKSCVCHSYENCRVCTNNSHSATSSSRTRSRNHSSQYPSSFISDSCALFCMFLHPSKTQPLSFQAIPHSLPKKHRGVGRHQDD